MIQSRLACPFTIFFLLIKVVFCIIIGFYSIQLKKNIYWVSLLWQLEIQCSVLSSITYGSWGKWNIFSWAYISRGIKVHYGGKTCQQAADVEAGTEAKDLLTY